MDDDSHLPSPLGFIGLGQIGGPIACTLIESGYSLRVWDLRPEAMNSVLAAGASPASDISEIVRMCDVVLLSLPSSEAFVEVAEHNILPTARTGQIIVDLGTTTPPETRRAAALFAKLGTSLLDVPVSGGATGARTSSLYLFGGGDPAGLETLRPLFGSLGCLTICGPSGAGQVVKGVNQLMMALGSAAYLEALAYGVRTGIDADIIAEALGNEGQWRRDFNKVASLAAAGEGDSISVKFRELPYFLRDAQEKGFPLPLTSALHAFCAAGERIAFDDHRNSPSFWWQLISATRAVSVDGPSKPMPRSNFTAKPKEPSNDDDRPNEA